jgi:hypothetical protein
MLVVMPRRVLCIAALAVALAGCGGASRDADVRPIDSPSVSTTRAQLPSTTSSSTTPTTVALPVVETTTTTAPPPPTRCTGVVHLGDSTSTGMVSASFLPPSAQLDAQYARVGVTEAHLEIDGARSIVETHHGSPNARDRAASWSDAGYQGCWVFALGTTDAANFGAGSYHDATTRIDRMMAVAGNQPVLWVTVKTLVLDGAWSNANMQLWNQALVEAATRYPNVRVFDWNAVVQDNWFAIDGIHYTSEGYGQRAQLIADALGQGFPPY